MSYAYAHSLARGRRFGWALGQLLAAIAVVTLVLTGSAAAGQSAPQAAGAADGSAPPKREYLIKAAILYNFAKFTRWPAAAFASADAPLELCVIGVDPFGEALATIDGKHVGQHTLRTRLIADTAKVASCHLLFVSASETERLSDVLAAADGAAVLTVADLPEFARAGGMISLKVVEDRTRFDVNRAAADRAGLTLSAKLLRLAETVIQD
jgi:hypothetical protein